MIKNSLNDSSRRKEPSLIFKSCEFTLNSLQLNFRDENLKKDEKRNNQQILINLNSATTYS